MGKTAFLYPGQGSQKVGMGADFYQNSSSVRAFFKDAGKACGLDLEHLCFEKNELLDQTEYTQPALVCTCLAMTEEIQKRGLKPDGTAGLSLGEYAAVAAAGGLKAEDAVRLVAVRGKLMQHSVPAGKGAMCAVLAMKAEKIEELLRQIPEVQIANYNCPGQIVITGRTEKVIEAADLLKEAGAMKTIMLNVSGPFHSPMMVEAGEKLAAELSKAGWNPLQIPYYTNVTADQVTEIDSTPELMKKQISEPVRWMQCMEQMIADGFDTFVEIGPGRTLSGFMKKINKEVRMYHISSWEEMEQVIERFENE